MTAVIPREIRARGTYVALEPLTPDSSRELYAALGRPEVFAGGFGGGPAALAGDEEGFAQWLQAYSPPAGASVVVRLLGGGVEGRAVGTSALYEFDPDHESCCLGYTAYHPGVWGGVVNAECKLLMLRAAFSAGFGRVELRADAANARSRAAITKLGATLEGLRRRDRPRADGTWRDAAIFSITIDDWPRVEAGLMRRVATASRPVASEDLD